MNFEALFQYGTWVVIFIYIVFYLIDRKAIVDEREELIQLKTLDLCHKVTLTLLTALAILSIYNQQLLAAHVISLFAIVFLITEMIGKLYFRWKF